MSATTETPVTAPGVVWPRSIEELDACRAAAATELHRQQRNEETAAYYRRAGRDAPTAVLTPPRPHEVEALARWRAGWSHCADARRIGFGPRAWWATFDAPGLLQTAAVRRARQWVDQDFRAGARAFVMLGPTGVGKTIAAACLLHRLRARLRAADATQRWSERQLAVHVGTLGRQLMDSDQRSDAMARACTVDDLVLDDFGATYLKAGGFLEALLEEVLIEREAFDRVTIISSNLTRAQFDAEVGDRIADRLRGEWGSIVELPGASLRQKAPRP